MKNTVPPINIKNVDRNCWTGHSFLLNVPPGWILTGTVIEDKDGYLTIDKCTWVSSVQAKKSIMDLCDNNVKATNIVSNCYSFKSGMFINKEAVFLASPVTPEVVDSLFYFHDMKALDNV